VTAAPAAALAPVALTVGDLLGGAAAAVLAAALFWLAFLTALRLLPEAPPAVRLTAAAVAAMWLPVALFWLLTPLAAFRLPVVLPLLVAAAVSAHLFLARGRRPAAALGGDLRRAGSAAATLARHPAGWLLGAVLVVALVRLVRGLAAPPLAWDALTYHLLKAGRWVQDGAVLAEAAPDAWGYYEYFPPAGDVLWAWTLLPVSGDSLVAAAGAAIWAAALLGVYAAARGLGAGRPSAAVAAAAVGSAPSTLTLLSSAYVDTLVVALIALAAALVVHLHRRPSEAAGAAVAACAALGLAAGVKFTALPLAGLGTAAVAWGVLAVGRRRLPWRRCAALLLVCAGALAAGAPGYLRAWSEQGSPFYPYPLDVPGLGPQPASEALAELGRAEVPERLRLRSPLDFVAAMVWRPTSEGAFVNPGPALPLLVFLAVAALPAMLRDRRTRTPALWLALSAALLLWVLLVSDDMRLFRTTVRATSGGRYLGPALVTLAVLAAPRLGRWTGGLLAAASLGGLWLALPRGWTAVEAAPVAGAALLVAAVAAGAGAGLHLARGRNRSAAALLVLLAALAVAALGPVRRPHRYPLWAAAAEPAEPLFHLHRLHPTYAAAWPLWQALDGERPLRLAVTAGWDGAGHNWYRYPLLGSRLQNRVVYVPVTADGTVVDYRLGDQVERRAELRPWLGRLLDLEVDAVVSLAPRWTVEDAWMRGHPEVFRRCLGDRRNLHAVFCLDRSAAAALAAGGGAKPNAEAVLP
jgi:hypothetical protein